MKCTAEEKKRAHGALVMSNYVFLKHLIKPCY